MKYEEREIESGMECGESGMECGESGVECSLMDPSSPLFMYIISASVTHTLFHASLYCTGCVLFYTPIYSSCESIPFNIQFHSTRVPLYSTFHTTKSSYH